MMHDGECLIGVGTYSGRKPTPLEVIHNKDRNVGAMKIAQTVNLVHVAVASVGEPPNVIEVRPLPFDRHEQAAA